MGWISIWISIWIFIWISIWISITYMLFGHETSFILRYGHQTGTIRIRKPFSIDLNDQNQVPIGPYEGFYRNFEFFDKKSNFFLFFFIVRGVFLEASEGSG